VRAVVVGGGSWGTAFSRLLADHGHSVTLAVRDPEQARAIAETKRNPRYMTSVSLDGIDPSTIEDAPFEEAVAIVLAVPSRAFGDVVRALPGDAPVLSLTKGLDPATGQRLSTLVQGRPVAVLSGPNMAEEIAAGLPTAAAIASEDIALAESLQREINSSVFRVYVNRDLVGVELCAAAKNVIALAAGAVDGLGLGDNAKAALITRGLAEIARLGVALGAQPATFSGLAGLGDLVLTCTGSLSRNRALGREIARGRSLAEAEAATPQIAEGVRTTATATRLAREIGVPMPICEEVGAVLFHDKPVAQALEALLARDPRPEEEVPALA
jgi:glycerol-3-phosphate dehydrogenase (NAD(P)+)